MGKRGDMDVHQVTKQRASDRVCHPKRWVPAPNFGFSAVDWQLGM